MKLQFSKFNRSFFRYFFVIRSNIVLAGIIVITLAFIGMYLKSHLLDTILHPAAISDSVVTARQQKINILSFNTTLQNYTAKKAAPKLEVGTLHNPFAE